MAPPSTTFTFTVPDTAGFEDVPVVVSAIDSSSNIASTSSLLLRVSGFNTVSGRVGSIVFQGNNILPLSDPKDVVATATSGEFVILDSNKLVRVSAGGVASIYSGYNAANGRYITRGANGDLFLSRPASNLITRVGSSVGNPVTLNFLTSATSYTGI